MTSEIVTSYCKIIQTEAVTFLVLRMFHLVSEESLDVLRLIQIYLQTT